jgi:hypothetical protein
MSVLKIMREELLAHVDEIASLFKGDPGPVELSEKGKKVRFLLQRFYDDGDSDTACIIADVCSVLLEEDIHMDEEKTPDYKCGSIVVGVGGDLVLLCVGGFELADGSVYEDTDALDAAGDEYTLTDSVRPATTVEITDFISRANKKVLFTMSEIIILD